MNRYDPKVHHRRSIRLKGYDYAGGGLYFVTICAHREFIRFGKGKPFGDFDSQNGATGVSPVREMIEKIMVVTERKNPFWKWEESVIMPDHFHALVQMEPSNRTLGNVIGSFKAAVSKEIRRRGNTCVARLARTRIWHRNYYEMIVRDDEEEKNIKNYIRMNPWKCVMNLENGLRGMGNPSLWNMEKLGVLCSRGASRPEKIPNADVYISGFHSPMEKKIFERLLELKKPVIYCPAWGIAVGATHLSPVLLKALEENRMLILEMDNVDGNLAAAEDRNRFVIENADDLWLPYVAKGGMLERLIG